MSAVFFFLCNVKRFVLATWHGGGCCCCCHHHRPVLPAVAVSTLACFESLLQCLYCCVCVCILHSCEIWPASASVFWCSVLAAVVTLITTQQPPPTVLPFWCFALVVRHASSVMDCILPLMVCPCLAVCAARLGTAVAVYLLPHPPLRMCGGVQAAARGSCGHRSGGCCTCL